MANKKTTEEEVKEQFLKDVSDHKLQIYLSHGVYRHLRLADPKTNCYSFHLITGPGFLLYRGDMGTFEFERVHDMLQFFEPDDCEKLTVNPGYWAEKIQATDKDGGHQEFDREYFEEVVREEGASYLDNKEATDEVYEDFVTQVEGDILSRLYDVDISEAIQAAMDFRYKGKRPFADIYEYNFHRPTYHYLWACYAIVWGIQQYRKYQNDGAAAYTEVMNGGRV
jgi:hypothetical protein